MRQESLNREMVEAGIARYRSKVESARVRGREADAPYGQRLMRAALPDYINVYRNRQAPIKPNSRAFIELLKSRIRPVGSSAASGSE